MGALRGDGFLHGGSTVVAGRRVTRLPPDIVAGVMRVWIDQDLCTGDGLCLDHCPDVFVQLEDGIAYVAEAGVALNDPGGSGSLAWVPERHQQAVDRRRRALPGRVHLHRARSATAPCVDPGCLTPRSAGRQAPSQIVHN